MSKRVSPDATSVFELRRPDLYGWLVRNQREVEARLSEGLRPGWSEFAAVLTESGFTKPGGGPITAAYARQTWWKVRRRLQTEHPTVHPAPAPQRRLLPELTSPTVPRQFTPAKIKE